MRIAVVGSGVSGLVAGYLLGEAHDVTLYEAELRPGGHVNTVQVDSPTGAIAIDTGFIVYNACNYPLFSALLKRLGVQTQPTDMSFGVRDDRAGIEYSGRSFDTLFAQRINLAKPAYWRMIADIAKFMKYGRTQLWKSRDADVAEFIALNRYSRGFAERFLIPLTAALWSCPAETVSRFPARFVLDFLHNHGMLQLKNRPQWRVVSGGSARYVEKLLKATCADMRFGLPVLALGRTKSGICLRTAAGEERYDEVVVACHSDQALRILERPTSTEQSVLSQFKYRANDVVLHTDTSVLPVNRRAWAAWNYRAPAEASESACVTYHMNYLQSLHTRNTYCVSLNETAQIAPEKVIQRFTYHHPIATLAGAAAHGRRAELIRHHGISYCGAYWGYGFHEDGVRSAYEVSEAFRLGLAHQ